MSDYLASIVARTLNQTHGFRFTAGDLRPRLASRFEQPASAWSEEPPGLFEEEAEIDGGQPARAGRAAPSSTPRQRVEAGQFQRPIEIAGQTSDFDQAAVSDATAAPDAPVLQATPRARSADAGGHEPAAEPQPPIQGSESRAATSPLPKNLPELTVMIETPTEEPRQSSAQLLNLAPAKPAGQSRAARTAAAGAARLSYPPPAGRNQYSPGEGLEANLPSPAAQRSAAGDTTAPGAMPAPEQLNVMRQTLARIRDWGPEDEAPAAPPTVNVTIGRIEVRAAPADVKTAPPRSSTPMLTLEEYMRRRAGGGGS